MDRWSGAYLDDPEVHDRLPVVAIVLEEAQRVLSSGSDRESNVFPRIAREGRKFKVGITAITQQPKLLGELGTVLGQRGGRGGVGDSHCPSGRSTIVTILAVVVTGKVVIGVNVTFIIRSIVRLLDLVRDVPGATLVQGDPAAEVRGVVHDSRRVRPGEHQI